MTQPAPHAPALGSLLVALQFGLLAALGLLAGLAWRQAGTAPMPASTLPLDALLLAGVSMALGLWALACNRPGNFHIRPLPKTDGALVQHGPYRWIRHPMYTALLLLAAAIVRLTASAAGAGASVVSLAGLPLGTWAVLCWAALLGVLVLKARVEEVALRLHHPGYAAYCERSRRFLPGLW
ncbi:MAG: hypothetical protein RLZZ584_3179 [Pseudomonadota bacterium]